MNTIKKNLIPALEVVLFLVAWYGAAVLMLADMGSK